MVLRQSSQSAAINHIPALSVVVLAAGSASRFGYRPKCLIELDGVALIRKQIQALCQLGFREVTVVLGHYAELIRNSIEDLPISLIENLSPDDGQVSSLRLGLKTVDPLSCGTLVSLADMPLINRDDLLHLVEAYIKRPIGSHVVVPSYQNSPGNPVIFDAVVRDSILNGPLSFGCKDWQRHHPESVYLWPTENNHYKIDIDSVDDLFEANQIIGLNLRWPDFLGAEGSLVK
jgi:molybdenum cofactor cytidylyltransferase